MTKTKTMFDQLYRRVAILAGEPIERLFSRLESYAASRDNAAIDVNSDSSQITEAVSSFFEELYPRVYGQSPRSVQGPSLASQRLPNDYADCLKRVQSELRPFGEIPRRLAVSLTKSLDAVKSLVSAIHLGVHVLNATDHAELNTQCKDALFRATHCAQCRGLAAPVRSPVTNGGGVVCRGLCSNVARGCLAAVADVDQPWNEWVDAMERLTLALLNKHTAGDLAPHEILSSVDSRLSEAVLYALENGPLLEKKVRRLSLLVFLRKIESCLLCAARVTSSRRDLAVRLLRIFASPFLFGMGFFKARRRRSETALEALGSRPNVRAARF